MAAGPSKSGDSSPPGTARRNSQQPNGSAANSSPPSAATAASTKSPFTLSAAAFVPASAQPQQHHTQQSYPYNMSSMGEHRDRKAQSFPDGDRPNLSQGAGGSSTILIRRLSRSMTENELRSMFLFAKDFIDSEFIGSPFADDAGFVCAIARFRTPMAAQEVQAVLDGKLNTANEANMVVQTLPSSMFAQRRNTVDGMVNRDPSSSTSSSASSSGPPGRQSSRYNETFQSLDRLSPPMSSHGMTNGDFPTPESNSHFQNLFSPQSPIATHAHERLRVTGKSVINDDAFDDDETGELLKDPLGFAQNGHVGGAGVSMPRRSTGSSQPVPIARFGGLSLSTNPVSPPSAGSQSFASPRSSLPMQSPASAMSPGMMNHQANNYQLTSPHLGRANYPPANPADQNPPCNTLYVGNLPIDTSEDELKALFSKQRGYKRLCFRTKQNGPMCFVEFEDVSFATKALTELYGHLLHNSVKGGIRLSFSKNPLGVRTGQQQQVNGHGMPTPPGPHGAMPAVNHAMSPGVPAGGGGGGGGGVNQQFITANGPPPGLTMPPGLHSPVGLSGGPMGSMTSPIGSSFANGGFSSGSGFRMMNNTSAGPPSMAGGMAASGVGPEYQTSR